ncbi:polycystic kidney disease protein 1-like 1 [Echinops telfairi]|uniref:Polycystic kidney disease protein 1-like 1 n=1 Tax=Echinops telfairi TaxID=9371 RepID=A0ABM0ZRQ8_ECHTE|nr:polycystic kidney disease protein 1-like 1 [Echinops telfairi]
MVGTSPSRSFAIGGIWNPESPSPTDAPNCTTGEADVTFFTLLKCNYSAVVLYSLKMENSGCIIKLLCPTENVVKKLAPGACLQLTTVKAGACIEAVGPVQDSTKHPALLLWPTSYFLAFLRSTGESPPCAYHAPGLSATQPGFRNAYFLTTHPTEAIPTGGPTVVVTPVTQCFPATDTWTTPVLGLRVQMASEGSVFLGIDFGDDSGVQMRIQNVSGEISATACHQYREEGVWTLKAVLYNESYGTEVELGPYYLEIGCEIVSVFLNSSSVHENEVILFADSHTDQKSKTSIWSPSHHFTAIPSYNVSFMCQKPAGDNQAWPGVTVRYKMQPVSIYTNGTVFATDVDITFVAVTKETSPLEFEWHFGEDPPVRTTSRSIGKRLRMPQWYHVVVKASNGITSVVSEPHSINIQKKIIANRLSSISSALVNASVTFECRINFGTDVAYLWNFGDGTISPGNSTQTHSYTREGEFSVVVLAFNDVSSASLRKQLFIVRTPCQPPPVKNMGPEQVQVWRSQPVRLGVTFEAAILCDISQGLSYTWSFMRSDGSHVSLPSAVDNHKQTIVLPSYALDYGNYTAVAKVQVEGSVVYSNYSVGVDVRARAPVSVISEGTHLFISRTPSSTIVLSGSQSYDPDDQGTPLRYHWKCAPAVAPSRSCFHAPAPGGLNTTAPIISFSATDLSASYDQFLVTLMVSSSNRTSSVSQVFLSLHSEPASRFIHLSQVNFKNNFVNWNEELSLRAVCERCDDMYNLSYSWDLFLVNATEQTSLEGELCLRDCAEKRESKDPVQSWFSLAEAILCDSLSLGAVELLDSSRLGTIMNLSKSNPQLVKPNPRDPGVTIGPFSWEHPQMTIGQSASSAMVRHSQASKVNRPQAVAAVVEASGQEDDIGEAELSQDAEFLEEGSPVTSPWETKQPSGSSLPQNISFYLSVPFCRAVELLDSSRLGTIMNLSKSNPQLVKPNPRDPGVTIGPFSWEHPQMTIGQSASSAMVRHSQASKVNRPQAVAAVVEASGQEDDIGEAELSQDAEFLEEGSPVTSPWETKQPSGSSLPQNISFYLSDFEAYYGDIQEAVPSSGRQPGTNMNFPESEPSQSDDQNPEDGDNLLDPFHSMGSAIPLLMIDWPKSLISRAIFQGYTSTGVVKRTVTIKPFSLRSGKTYVIQASAASKHIFLGKAQLYLTVNRVPQNVACQVQPHRGHEAQTIFSVFCMSGEPDFHYEFSYWIGNGTKRTLYHGRDAQYYFALPAGEPLNNYRVMVSTEITDGEGSKSQPCVVAVTVLPRFHENATPADSCPSEDLYNSSLKNLSALQRTRSFTETRNYIIMITRILSRLAKEGRGPSCGHWSAIQDAFISSVFKLDFVDQEEIIDSVLMLRDLISFPNELTFRSGSLIIKYMWALLARSQLLERFVTDRELMLKLIGLVSGVWQVSEQEKSRTVDYLREEGIKVISHLLLNSLFMSGKLQLHIGTEEMEFQACFHDSLQKTVQSMGSVQVHLPREGAGQHPAGAGIQNPCYISQTILFKLNSYPGGQAPGQLAGTVDVRLYNCSSRRPCSRRWLPMPVTVEFKEEDDLGKRRNETAFVLPRDKVNFHQFIGHSENSQESLQIRIQFVKTITRAFPIMLLVRSSKKPTPSDFLVKQMYLWDEKIIQIYIPAVLLKDSTSGYLAILDASYDRPSSNKYLASTVNYTVDFQWLQCLFWDKRRWKSNTLPPQPGTSPDKVNCSYDHLTAFTLARRKLNASFEMSDISTLQRHPENLIPSVFIVLFMILYAFLVTKSMHTDHHERKKSGYIFLQGSSSPDQQLYAVVIDTGFRAPSQLTAKVYIVLYGETGLSETRELSCPEKPLFERNSRHTFILSVPGRLGPLWKVRLWHNNRGPSPSWYISHLLVQDLCTGQSWFFPAECWLAAGHGDGKVERELIPLHQGPGFWKLLYAKFTEFLEDFHIWISVYSRPSYSCYLHTQRLTISFSLLCMYSCLTAALTAAQEQLSLDVSPTHITSGSFRTSLLCTLVAFPGALLLSLLFRLSQVNSFEMHSYHAPSGGLAAPAPQWQQMLSPWLSFAGWVLCTFVSIACCLGTGILGYRFGPTQCAQWLHLLILSVMSCALITQPMALCLRASGFAWKRKDDKAFFTESLCDATKELASELEHLSQTCVPLSASCGVPDCASEFEKILATRQHTRHLRWACPPSIAQLRTTKERMRKEAYAQTVLRDFFMSILMFILLVFIIYGKFSQDEYALNQAIRNEFTRNIENSFGGLKRFDDWWEWSLTKLLDGLYGDNMQRAQTGALGGKCYLIGTVVIKQLNSPPNNFCKSVIMDTMLHLMLVLLLNGIVWRKELSLRETEPLPTWSQALKQQACGSLCLASSEVHTALINLRAKQWIGKDTKAVSVHFTFFNPPTQLLTSVSLRAEVLPAGSFLFSSQVESVHIFLSDSATRYLLLLPELLFLMLNMVHLCFQLFSMIEKGIFRYWKKISNWLEFSVVGLSLAYYAASNHLVILAGGVINQFHKEFFQEFVDLRFIVSWNQRLRWLQGILLFLLIFKSICPLSTPKTMVYYSFLLCHSDSMAITQGLAGFLVVALHSHLHNLLLCSQFLPLRTFADSSHMLPVPFWGRSRRKASAFVKSDQWAMAYYHGAICTVMTTLWLAMLRVSLMNLTRKRNSFQNKYIVRLKDVTAYTWEKVLVFLGLERPRPEETQGDEHHTYYLDEFEDLLDVLLLKIDDLSNSLHIPALETHTSRTREARADESPAVGIPDSQAAQFGKNRA